MALKRDKILKDAEKLVQKGKLEQAITQYEKILRKFPNDTTIINRVGDLYGRVGQLQRSIELYEEIADHFTSDGFTTKAIAILKKIQRLDPQRLDIFERLANLYFDQGLMVEAKREYQILADWYVKNGELEKAIDAHEKLVNLDPSNHLSSLRLADLLLKRGEIGSAIKVYDRLGNMLLDAGKLDEAERLYRHVLGQNPPGGEFLVRVCEVFLDSGRTPMALEFLNFAIKKSPDSVELMVLLARTHKSMGEHDRAKELAAKVLAVEPGNARIRALMGEEVAPDEAEMIGQADVSTARELLDRSDHQGAQAILKDLLEKQPEDQEILRLAVRAWGPSSDQETLFTLRAALAESYFNSGELEAAKRLFIDLLDTEPDNQRFRERLAALHNVDEGFYRERGVGATEDSEVVEIDDDLEEIEFEKPEEEPKTAAPAVDDSGGGLELSGEGEQEPSVQPRVEPKVEPVGPPEDFDLEERLAEASVFAKYGLIEKAISHLEDVVLFCPDEIEPRQRLAMLYAEHGDKDAAVSMAGPVIEHHRAQGTDDQLGALMAAIPELADAPAASGGGKATLADETPTISDAVAPSTDAARDQDSDLIEIVEIEDELTPSAVVDQPPALDEISIEVEPQPGPAPVESPPVAEEAAVAPEPAPEAPAAPRAAPGPVEKEVADELVEISDSFVGPSMSDLEQIDFFIDQELYEDAARVLMELEEEHPDDPEVASRRLKLKEVGVLLDAVETVEEGAEQLFADEEQYIDLAKELEAELAAEEAMVDEATGRGKGEAILEEVFREFQKGVAEQLSDEDSDTHYNLGIAYREMGLLPEAIREFQVSSRDPAYFVESCSIIGVCYQEQGMWSEAASWYQKAMVAPDLTEEARVGLRYDLAVSYEAAGDLDQAVALFEEILSADPAYRDVSQRLAGLGEQRQAN